MDRLYVFLIRNDIWIYILSAIGLVWYLTEIWRSRNILRSAIFGLEKEKGERIRRRAVSLSILFIGVIGLVTYVNLRVAPTLPVELLKPPTPTPNIFSTPLSRAPTETPQGTVVFDVAPTVTLAGGSIEEPIPEITPAINEDPTETPFPPVNTGGCEPEIVITSPPNGTSVNNTLTLFGTVMGEQFSAYSIEILGPDTSGEWVPLTETIRLPVQDGILGTISFANYPLGNYFVRLRAFGLDGEELGQCAVAVLVGSEPS